MDIQNIAERFGMLDGLAEDIAEAREELKSRGAPDIEYKIDALDGIVNLLKDGKPHDKIILPD